jgi:hypothetical protein
MFAPRVLRKLLAAPAAQVAATLLSVACGHAGATAAAAAQPIDLRFLARSTRPIALSGHLAAVWNGSGIEIFARRGKDWSRQAEITPPGLPQSLALAGDSLVVGGFGYASVYARAGQSWRLDDTISALDGNYSFGYAVAIAGDVLIVGGPNYLYPHATGHAFVFRRDASGRWSSEATLDGYDDPNYGSAVAVTGGFAFVGGVTIGLVDVYQRGPRRWRHVDRLTGGATSGFGVGFGTAVSASGATLAVGGDELQVFVFVEAQGRWSEQARIPTPNPGFTSFGLVVATGGETIAAGDQLNDAAYVYTRDEGGGWTLTASVSPPRSRADFGLAVAASGPTVLAAGRRSVWVVEGLALH